MALPFFFFSHGFLVAFVVVCLFCFLKKRQKNLNLRFTENSISSLFFVYHVVYILPYLELLPLLLMLLVLLRTEAADWVPVPVPVPGWHAQKLLNVSACRAHSLLPYPSYPPVSHCAPVAIRGSGSHRPAALDHTLGVALQGRGGFFNWFLQFFLSRAKCQPLT